MEKDRLGVLLMAHGTPSSLDEMPEYLRLVRGGRAPSPEVVEQIRRNYAAIGGRSPLTGITIEQGRALQRVLDARGVAATLAVGMRYWKPFIADVVPDLLRAGVTRVLGLSLAPHYSTQSVGKNIAAADLALPADIPRVHVRSFHDHPLLIEAFAERLSEAAPSPGEEVVFTAHSVPVRTIDEGDPYADEVAATAAAVATRCGLRTYERAWQSAGRSPEPWLGPDLSELLRARAEGGVSAFLIVPIGFVCDHTEILFDVDIQAAALARTLGVSLRRTASLNTSPAFIRLLADLVEREGAPHA